jgi:hypothetical protein
MRGPTPRQHAYAVNSIVASILACWIHILYGSRLRMAFETFVVVWSYVGPITLFLIFIEWVFWAARTLTEGDDEIKS